MNIIKKLPNNCPACASPLKVKMLVCEHCHTEVSGVFDMPALSQLSADEAVFILDFVKSSGSLKLMAQKMGLSYPTVRNRLDDIIQKIETNEKRQNNSK
jgi:hypothetical protein